MEYMHEFNGIIICVIHNSSIYNITNIARAKLKYLTYLRLWFTKI